MELSLRRVLRDAVLGASVIGVGMAVVVALFYHGKMGSTALLTASVIAFVFAISHWLSHEVVEGLAEEDGEDVF